MKNVKFIFILLLLCFYLVSFSQNPFFKTINKSDGLVSNTIYDIIQNKDGFIFLGTDKGLVKYDGVSFYNYKTTTKNSKAISNVIEVEDGNVFCQSFIGEVFKTHKQYLMRDSILNSTGNYYTIKKIDTSLVVFNIDTIKFYNYKKNTLNVFSAKNINISSTLKHKKQIYAIDSSYNLVCFKNKQWVKVLRNSNKKLDNSFYLEQTANGILFLKKTNNQKVNFFTNNKLIEVEGINENVFINNIKIIKDKTWICTTSGLYVFDAFFKTLNNYKPYFKDYNISNIIIDKEGAYWITTIDKGILYVPNFEVKEYGKSEYQFSCISNYKNSLLLGTYDNQIIEFNKNKKSFLPIYNVGYANEINAIVYDSINNSILAGSDHLYIIKEKKVVYKNSFAVKDIKLTKNQIILLAFSTGAVFIKPSLTTLKYNFPKNTKPALSDYFNIIQSFNSRSRAIEFINSDSLIFIANSKGLFKIANSIITEIKVNDSSIIASSLHVNNNNLYIGTFSKGLFVFNTVTNSITEIALANTKIKNISKIKSYNNNIFVINDDGFFKINKKTNHVSFFNISDGVNSQAELKDFIIQSDTAFIASNQGLIILPIKLNSTNFNSPNVVVNAVTDFLKQEDSVYVLNKSSKDVSIHFSVLSYKGSDSVKVYYKINNDEWILLSAKERVLKLSYLATGKYSIKLKAINEDGVEFVCPEIIYLLVKPAFYQTWWFMLIVFSLSLGLGLWINKYRLRKILLKQKAESEKKLLKNQIDLSNLKTLRAQMNPHFIFNALNSIQSYVYSGNKELAGKYLSLFSDLSRSLLDNSAQTEVSLYDELKLIDLYLQLECIRLPKISYTITKDESINVNSFHLPAMIIQPIVENAIKHGLANKSDDCKLQIRITQHNNDVVFEIEDNGIGRLKSEELNKRKFVSHKSFASQAIESRISLLNKNSKFKIQQQIIDKFDGNKNPDGTLVIITIPLNYVYESFQN